jgi:hypothetical protein
MAERCYTPESASMPNKSFEEIPDPLDSDGRITEESEDSDGSDRSSSSQRSKKLCDLDRIQNRKRSGHVMNEPREFVLYKITRPDKRNNSRAERIGVARDFIKNKWTYDFVDGRGKARTIVQPEEKDGYRIDYQHEATKFKRQTYAIVSLQKRDISYATAHIEVEVKFGSEIIQKALCHSLEKGFAVRLRSRLRRSVAVSRDERDERKQSRVAPMAKRKAKQQMHSPYIKKAA